VELDVVVVDADGDAATRLAASDGKIILGVSVLEEGIGGT
jgi:hypothetical protein